MTTTETVRNAYMRSVLEQRIREDIPRLMELREGCIIKNNYNGDLEIFLGYISVDGFSRAVLKNLHTESIRLDIQGSIIIDEFKKYAYSIIGHDIMLNDWFEWLCGLNNDDNETYYVLTDNVLSVYNPLTDEQKDIVIDLSKPCLKDQPEELIKFLYNLKNK